MFALIAFQTVLTQGHSTLSLPLWLPQADAPLT
jgi:hypothetical protein